MRQTDRHTHTHKMRHTHRHAHTWTQEAVYANKGGRTKSTIIMHYVMDQGVFGKWCTGKQTKRETRIDMHTREHTR